MVIDCTEFIDYHPGGKFVIQINTGRDVSKFFYGGYCLEDNDPRPAQGYTHSNYAKMIANELIIGVYQVETNPDYVMCRVNTDKTHMWNSTTGTVFFVSKDGLP